MVNIFVYIAQAYEHKESYIFANTQIEPHLNLDIQCVEQKKGKLQRNNSDIERQGHVQVAPLVLVEHIAEAYEPRSSGSCPLASANVSWISEEHSLRLSIGKLTCSQAKEDVEQTPLTERR